MSPARARCLASSLLRADLVGRRSFPQVRLPLGPCPCLSTTSLFPSVPPACVLTRSLLTHGTRLLSRRSRLFPSFHHPPAHPSARPANGRQLLASTLSKASVAASSPTVGMVTRDNMTGRRFVDVGPAGARK